MKYSSRGKKCEVTVELGAVTFRKGKLSGL
jgi:hypothetical protein